MPSYRVGQLKTIIRDFFKKNVLVWNPTVGGLLLKNKSVQLLEKSAEFNDETGDAIVQLQCRSVFFVPTPGNCLARVKEIQSEFLVLNVLNLLDIMVEAQHISHDVFIHKDKVG